MWFDILKISTEEAIQDAKRYGDKEDLITTQERRKALEEKWERMKAAFQEKTGEPYDVKSKKPQYKLQQQELTPRNPKVKRVGLGKSAVKKWIKDFIRNHLESMAVGEKINTNDMITLLNASIGDATYLSPETGARGQRPEMQVKFAGKTKFDKHINPQQIGGILMRQNKDIVDVYTSKHRDKMSYVVRK